MRRQRTNTSCKVTLRACPMCKDPVTLGGGMTTENTLPSWSGSTWKRPCSSQYRYHRRSTSWGLYTFGISVCCGLGAAVFSAMTIPPCQGRNPALPAARLRRHGPPCPVPKLKKAFRPAKDERPRLPRYHLCSRFPVGSGPSFGCNGPCPAAPTNRPTGRLRPPPGGPGRCSMQRLRGDLRTSAPGEPRSRWAHLSGRPNPVLLLPVLAVPQFDGILQLSTMIHHAPTGVNTTGPHGLRFGASPGAGRPFGQRTPAAGPVRGNRAREDDRRAGRRPHGAGGLSLRVIPWADGHPKPWAPPPAAAKP